MTWSARSKFSAKCPAYKNMSKVRVHKMASPSCFMTKPTLNMFNLNVVTGSIPG